MVIGQRKNSDTTMVPETGWQDKAAVVHMPGPLAQQWGKGRAVMAGVWSSPEGRLGLCIVMFFIGVAIFANFVAPYDPYEQSIRDRFAAPSWAHPFGTDYLGRDILSRMVYGSRTSMYVAFGTNILSVAVGVFLGMLAGRNKANAIDYSIILMFDMIRSFPQILLALAIVAVLGPSLTNVVIALSFTLFPFYGRIARTQTLSLMEAPFIKAGQAMGVGTMRLMGRHLASNIMAPILVAWGMEMTNMIIHEAGLSFLGLGIAPPGASWGNMLRKGFDSIYVAPWMIIFPSLVLFVGMLGFTLLSTGLRIGLDPHERRSDH